MIWYEFGGRSDGVGISRFWVIFQAQQRANPRELLCKNAKTARITHPLQQNQYQQLGLSKTLTPEANPWDF
jgi:hypothetical protein